MIERMIPNLCATDLAASRDFFVALLEFEVAYDSDWYVQLKRTGAAPQELGIISTTSELVPEAFQQRPAGMYLTFVVPDVDAVFEKAKGLGAPIVQPPRNEFYGQRRFLTTDPSGCLIDICSPWSEAEK